jgi:hypothetical protein
VRALKVAHHGSRSPPAASSLRRGAAAADRAGRGNAFGHRTARCSNG